MKFPECESCGTRLFPELAHCPQCGESINPDVPVDLRCECGFLLCKLTWNSIEVKCRRCRRLVEIPIDGIEDRFGKNKEKQDAWRAQRAEQGESSGQYCPSCGQFKPSVIYGKCVDCRTESIKVQYKSKNR